MATVSLKSRYKDTSVYVYPGGMEVMGPFQPPPEFAKPTQGWTIHALQEYEVGFPDILAVRYYGPGSEPLWWVIALVNGVIDVDLDLRPGQRILIPPRDVVLRYAARRSRAG